VIVIWYLIERARFSLIAAFSQTQDVKAARVRHKPNPTLATKTKMRV